VKKIAHSLTPPLIWEALHKVKVLLKPLPKEVEVDAGRYQLIVPRGHRLQLEAGEQPYRNLAVGIIARHAGVKCPDACMVDVGANVGDTGAMMASYCTNKLVLVDPSDIYFPYLQRNAQLFPNPVELVKGIVAGEGKVQGTLVHEGGTARITNSESGHGDFKQFKLSELGGGRTCFVKIDTDGFDYEIMQSSGDFLKRVHPVVYWEGEVSSQAELVAADATLDSLWQWGYTIFAVWDDPGFFILSTGDISAIKQLHRYLFEVGKHSYRRSIYNYNIAAFHEADGDVARAVVEHFQRINES